MALPPSTIPTANVTTDVTLPDVARSGDWKIRFRVTGASFKGCSFHVEQQARSSGRRIVEHEYPKRDLPYAEDMGRHAIRYTVTGYVIDYDFRAGFSLDYQQTKNRLIAALEQPDPGVLIDPYLPITSHLDYGGGKALLFYCERYSVSETRQRGGYCVFEMTFVEAGVAAHTTVFQLTEQVVMDAAAAAARIAAEELDRKQAEIASGNEYASPPQIPEPRGDL